MHYKNVHMGDNKSRTDAKLVDTPDKKSVPSYNGIAKAKILYRTYKSPL